MNDNFQTFYWSKLDNVAKLYALVSSSKATNVFRISVKMTEEIQAEFLSQAVKAATCRNANVQCAFKKWILLVLFRYELTKAKNS